MRPDTQRCGILWSECAGACRNNADREGLVVSKRFSTKKLYTVGKAGDPAAEAKKRAYHFQKAEEARAELAVLRAKQSSGADHGSA